MGTRPAIFKWRQTELGIILCAVRWWYLLLFSFATRCLRNCWRERVVSVSTTQRSGAGVQYYGPELEQRLRLHLKPTNKSWRVDETYVRVKGPSCYLYRAIDSAGAAIDFLAVSGSVTLMLPNACFARRSAIDPIPNLE